MIFVISMCVCVCMWMCPGRVCMWMGQVTVLIKFDVSLEINLSTLKIMLIDKQSGDF